MHGQNHIKNGMVVCGLD